MTHEIVDMGSLTWVYTSGTSPYFKTAISGVALNGNGELKCTALKALDTQYIIAMSDRSIILTNGVIYAKESEYTNSNDFKTAFTGQKIVYPLATPIELTLTPAQLSLLEGTNILTTDGDKITLKYLGSEASNVQRVLDNTFKSFAPVEESIATTNHAVGDYISYDTQFCKVTQAISVGEEVVVGRNVEVTTVAAELLAILARISA